MKISVIRKLALIATLASSTANATTFDYNFKTASELGNSSSITAAAGNYLQFTDITGAATLRLQVYGGHVNDTKSATNSALNTVSGAAVTDWKNYGLGVSYGSDSSSNETHQIDNINGGVDFVALIFDQAVTLSSIGLTAYPLNSNSFIDTDLSYAAFSGSAADLANGVNLTSFSTNSVTQTSGANSFSRTVNTGSALTSKIWLVGAAVGTDRDDAFKLTSFSLTSAPAAVPEPASWALMLAGFGGIGAAMRRRRPTNQGVVKLG